MAINCEDLFKLNSFRDARLVAGKTGLGRKITWPYVNTTPTVSQWLYGGELLFLTGVGIPTDADSLLVLTRECIQKKLSGMVILLNPDIIPEIPSSLIEIADRDEFPIFQIPWNVKLIDLTQEIISYMEAEKEHSKNVKFFLETLLFSKNDDIESVMSFYNISLHARYCLCMVAAGDNAFTETIENNFQHLVASVRNITLSNQLEILSCSYAGSLIFLLTADNQNDITYLQNTIINSFTYIQTLHPNHPMYMAFSRVRNDIEEVKQGYKEIVKALSIKGLNILFPDHIVPYEKLGIYRLLFELGKTDQLKSYCLENIEQLITYDSRHSSNLLQTLKTYFKKNCHIAQTAQALFIHKNTLIYRMSLIKTLLDTDLTDAMRNLELFNSLLIYDYLDAD